MQKILTPIIREIIADTDTPISVFSKLKPFGAHFLLESAERGEQFGRFSIITLNHEGEMTIKDSKVKTTGKLSNIIKHNNPFEAVKDVMSAFKVEGENNSYPFVGGVAGFFSFDCIRYSESLPNIPKDDVNFPDIHIYLFMQVLIYDHLKHTLTYIRLIDKNDMPDTEIKKIKNDMDSLLDKINTASMPKRSSLNIKSYETYSNMTQSEYEQAVRTAKHHIKEGDIFQVVLSRRRTYSPAPDSFEIYRRLRSINPSPYMYYLDFDDYKIVGSSPECLTRLVDGVVETFPIAGTCKRGKTPEEDKAFAAALLKDEKELAEHAMLVDLGRNDIGYISDFGTVEVKDYMHIEHFSHVMHIVSRVKGQIKNGIDGVDALMYCLPAGTVSGAPKLRAIEIIDDLEPTRRGPYAGSIGYFDFRGNMDMCITIRTLMFKDGCVHAQAGAGIVYDSIPEKEYIETESKLAALFKALGTDDVPVTEVTKP